METGKSIFLGVFLFRKRTDSKHMGGTGPVGKESLCVKMTFI